MWYQPPDFGIVPFERDLLFAVVLLCGEADGGRIHDAVTKLNETRINMGLMYLTLDDLEERGLLEARTKGGQPTRIYRLTKMGIRALETMPEMRRLTEILGD